MNRKIRNCILQVFIDTSLWAKSGQVIEMFLIEELIEFTDVLMCYECKRSIKDFFLTELVEK